MKASEISRLLDGRFIRFDPDADEYELLADGVWGPMGDVTVGAILDAKPLLRWEIADLIAAGTLPQ